ncbi:mechanosensitive ion channel protein MscL [Paenibacillus sp. y28]|uniref:mechanosensitive ion channel protein MscL n=1 Tax=Paenibacillus sp. y28 TaxID=3129110 RepID=UPI003017821F
MVVFDVIVNGKVIETITPLNRRLKDIYRYVADQMDRIRKAYGANVVVKRRMLY